MVDQVSFLGVPITNKSFSAVKSETVSIGFSDGTSKIFPLVACK
jgi:hypothetical protein